MERDYRWIPGGFPPTITLSVHLTLLLMMVVRGMDYATGESPTAAHRLGAVEHAAPLWAWGIAFTTVATVGFVSMAWRWAGGVVAAHALGSGLYAAIGVGIVIDAVGRMHETGGRASWVVGIPLIALALTMAGAWKLRGLSIPIAVVSAVAIGVGLSSIELDGLRNAVVLFGVSALHAALTIGTAQVAAQTRIKRDREAGVL